MRNTSCTDSFWFSIQFKNQIYYFSDKKLNTSDDKSGKKKKTKSRKHEWKIFVSGIASGWDKYIRTTKMFAQK